MSTKQNNHIPWSDVDRLDITARIMRGEDYTSIARDYDTTCGNIRSIRHYRKWYQEYKNYILDVGLAIIKREMSNEGNKNDKHESNRFKCDPRATRNSDY